MGLTRGLELAIVLVTPTCEVCKLLSEGVGPLRPIGCALLEGTNARKKLLHEVLMVRVIDTLGDNLEEPIVVEEIGAVKCHENPKVLP